MRKIGYLVLIILLPLQMTSQQITPAIEKYVEQYFKDIGQMDLATLKKYVPDATILTQSYYKSYNDYIEEIIPEKLQAAVKTETINQLQSNFLFQILEVYFANPDKQQTWNTVEVVGFYDQLLEVELDEYSIEPLQKFGVYVLLKDKESNLYYTSQIDRLFLKKGAVQGGVVKEIELYTNGDNTQPLKKWKEKIKEELEVSTDEIKITIEADIVGDETAISAADTVKDASYVSIYSDLKTNRYKGKINNIDYVFEIKYAITEDFEPFYYLEEVRIEKDGVKIQEYTDIQMISQLSPLYVFKETDFSTVYLMKFKNDKAIEIGIIDENGKSTGYITFLQQ